MKFVKRGLKIIGWTFLSLILSIAIIGFLFVSFSPQFGGKPTNEDIKIFEKTGYYSDGVFKNLIPTSMDMDFNTVIDVMSDFMEGVPNAKPDFEIPIVKVDSSHLEKKSEESELIWFGHSAVLLKISGKKILFDPMLSEVPAPHPMLGGKRFSKELPIEIEELPIIDAIVISHDHYDHLDYESIQKLKSKTREFFVPLGVGAHFIEWGVDPELVHELAWWDEFDFEGLILAFTPARHFSGRGFNRNNTLWGSWVVKSENETVYFSGDGGYGDHFKAIGEKYGPFDFAMLECGQYNEHWAQIHMMPEETAQAGIDLNARLIMPIHWGAFTLALHSWTDPIERVSLKADELEIPLIAPKIGQTVYLDENANLQEDWWIGPY